MIEAVAQMNAEIRIAGEAPDFELPTWDGRKLRLSDYRGQRAVLLFFSAGMS